MSQRPQTESIEVLIVGAGFGGFAMAHALDRLGIENYLIVEQAEAIGGTWRDNTYPGAACDVPSHLYSLSFAPKCDWSRLFPRQAEILAHLEGLAADFIARDRVRLGWALRSLHWDDAERLWRARSASGQQLAARQVVSAMGGLHVPSWPQIAGRESFAGAQCHTARWDHAMQWAGKRVGVIGTGTSAIQVIPELARKAAALHVFQRTPAWVLPRPDFAIPRPLQRVFAAVPPVRLALRGTLYVALEFLCLALLKPRTAFWARALARRHLRRQIAQPALREALQADYPIGCKRIALSSDFYPVFAQANVQLETTAIAAIESGGVRLADGRKIELDVLVHASGFRPLDVLANVDVIGMAGQSLVARWAERPQTANGIAVPGFPNLFFVLGPNTALGHNSVLYMIESQVRHIARLLGRLRSTNATRIEASAKAQGRFMDRIDGAFPQTAWAGGCRSWYLDAHGRNIALWVGASWSYRWRLDHLRIENYLIDR